MTDPKVTAGIVDAGTRAAAGPAPSARIPPMARPGTYKQGPNGAVVALPPQAARSAPQQAANWLGDFQAACASFGITEISFTLGYSDHTQVSKAYHGQLRSTAAIQARWQAATAKGWVRGLTMRTRKVGKRGIKWDGGYLSHAALRSLVGLQVVVRGNGRGGLVVFEGALLKPVCVLQAPATEARP